MSSWLEDIFNVDS